jgi:hypothetical protein
VGYLLKDRVADVTEFTDAVSRIAAGGTALDREVVSSSPPAVTQGTWTLPRVPGVQNRFLCSGSGRRFAGDCWHVPFLADSVWIGAAARQACSDRGKTWFRSPAALAVAPAARAAPAAL